MAVLRSPRALAAEHAQNANALGWVMQKTLASLANPRQFVETLMDPRASRLIGAFHADSCSKSASCGADDAPPAPAREENRTNATRWNFRISRGEVTTTCGQSSGASAGRLEGTSFA